MNLRKFYTGWNYSNIYEKELEILLVDISNISNVSLISMKSKLRKRKYVEARAAYFILTDILFGETYSLSEIGSEVNRDYSTVIFHRNSSNYIKNVRKIIDNYLKLNNINYE